MLGSYIKQDMKFFVAKVNLKEQAKLGFTYLRPIQVAFESPKFMLPIRLGMVNADGPQELFVFALTRKGRVETTNYRTVRLPSDMDLPVFVKDGVRRLLPGDVQPAGEEGGHAGGVPRVRLGHGLVRPVRGRPAVERGAARARRLLGGRGSAGSGPAGDRADAGAAAPGRRPRPSSSPGSTCATTPRTSPRTWCSRRPATARTSRAATSCATAGRGATTAPRRGSTASSCAQRGEHEAQTLATSPAGARRHPQEDEPGAGAEARRAQVVAEDVGELSVVTAPRWPARRRQGCGRRGRRAGWRR